MFSRCNQLLIRNSPVSRVGPDTNLALMLRLRLQVRTLAYISIERNNYQMNTASNDNRILDCGHKPNPHSQMTTGTAKWRQSDGTIKEICLDCSYKLELDEMSSSERYVGYLSMDCRTLTTWPGRVMGNVVSLTKVRQCLDGVMCYVRVRDTKGNIWIGRGIAGCCCSLRRAKGNVSR